MIDINQAIKSEVRITGYRGKYAQRRTVFCFNCIICKAELWYRQDALKTVSGRCRNCKYKKEDVNDMYGTVYDIKKTHKQLKQNQQNQEPSVLWFIAPAKRREVWLESRGFKKVWSKFKYHDLPQYIQNKWEDETNETN